MATVALRRVEKRYPNGHHAVRDVSIDIADGEFLVLVGPSGCGKSTTLRMVAGLEEITGGEIAIDGRVVNDLEPGDRDIAMVFQNYALYPHMTVAENMAFGLTIRRVPRAEIERRVKEAAEVLAIGPLLGRRPRELSGGQRQRVALGRAIVREPKVFLFDEPLSNLDAKLRVQTRAEIARLHRRLASTGVYVTHDQVEAMTLGDRIAVMNHGVVQQIAPPLEIYRRPANRFVAAFVGSPAMNFFTGRIAGGVFEAANGGRLPLGSMHAPDGPAVLGVRPEDFVVTAADGGEPGFLRVVLDVVEHMGPETMAHFRLGEEDHVVRLDASSRAAPGDRVTVTARPEGIHLFAADEAGRRLG
ncbi:MAG: ABC transporter ATP-binding protein [Planctomycetaceae bacterium]